MCKTIKQSDWPWKFWGRRVFDYSRVGLVLPPSVRKWPNLHRHPQFITPTHSWHKTDSLFVVTLGMFRHAWAHLFEALIKNLILGAFKPSKPSPSKFICKNWDPSLFLFYDLKIHGKKIKNWWSRGLAFQENGKRNETKLIGHSC